MTLFTKELALLSQLSTHDVAHAIQIEHVKTQLDELLQVQSPIVSAYGVYNSGKSSLLNAIMDKDVFDTADARCTVESQSLEFKGLTLLDTPGLNASVHDDKTAHHAVTHSSLVLFVHNVRVGELDAHEVEELARLSRSATMMPIVWLVLTHCEGIDQEDIIRVQDRIVSQWQAYLDHPPSACFPVRTHTYQKGKQAHKPGLCDHAGIPALRLQLLDMSDALCDALQDAQRTAAITLLRDFLESRMSVLHAQEERHIQARKELEAQHRKRYALYQERATQIKTCIEETLAHTE